MPQTTTYSAHWTQAQISFRLLYGSPTTSCMDTLHRTPCFRPVSTKPQLSSLALIVHTLRTRWDNPHEVMTEMLPLVNVPPMSRASVPKGNHHALLHHRDRQSRASSN